MIALQTAFEELVVVVWGPAVSSTGVSPHQQISSIDTCCHASTSSPVAQKASEFSKLAEDVVCSRSQTLCDVQPWVQIWCMVSPDEAKSKLGDVQLWISFTFSWVYMLAQVQPRHRPNIAVQACVAPSCQQISVCGTV